MLPGNTKIDLGMIAMQPCEELKSILLHHYGKFSTREQADSIEGTYSLIIHQEEGAWKMVHLHVSIAVPNESIGG